MFGLRKSTYKFELICSDNINKQELRNADSVINYVIGVNNHLLDQDDSGWLFIEKVKESKKGSEVLYAAKIELPLLEDNHYFDQLLSPFYTRKKLPFEAVSPIVKDVKEEPVTMGPVVPDSLAALASLGEKKLQEEQEEPSVEIAETIEGREESKPVSEDQMQPTANNEQEVAVVNQQQIEELSQMIKLQQQEIENLKKFKEQNLSEMLDKVEPSISTKKETVQTERDEITVTPVKPQGLLLNDSVAVSTDNQTVNEVLEMVKKEFSNRLIDFAEEEMEKINEEIKQMDTRHTIENDVMSRLQQERNQVIEKEISILENEKINAIQEEKARHEAAVKTIENEYIHKKEEKLSETTVFYEAKMQTEVASEYQRQTEQLAKILEGKKEELLVRQKELNEGLKNDFSQVLTSFNQTHNKVIQQLEDQKTQNQPIDFLARLREAQ